jgi:hypothetical protein
MPHPCFNASEIQLARVRLSRFIMGLAEETATELGVTWRASPCAPRSLADVTREFRTAMLSGLPVRISSMHCQNTIYVRPEGNVAFRFVHDSRHFFLQAGFDTEPEMLVASCHLARLKRAGFGPESVEFRMLYADTLGQTLFLAETGQYVINQLRFALRCVGGSLQAAIAAEAKAQMQAAS